MALKLQNYSWWRFFDKAGDLANFEYDEENDKWSGTIYIDKVSTGLIEYEPLYCLEKIFDNTVIPGTGELGLKHPRKPNLTGYCVGATQQNVILQWKDNDPGYTGQNVPEIFLWSIDGYPGPEPILIKHDSLDIDLGDQTNDVLNPAGGTGGTGQPGQVPGSPFLDEALSIRVGLLGATENSYVRTLQFIDPNYLPESPIGTFGCVGASHVFAEVTFYGETEEEDVRLDTMLENLGDRISAQDFKIFDDTDINEALPDYIKLNQKRKELLLEWSNIFPFTGAYKALINVLKYFGYDQVTLKEYWLNIKEANGENAENVKRLRYKQTPIEDLFSDEPKTSNIDHSLYPSRLYKKTSKFGLFYDITRDSGKFDNDGIPIVEEAFIFSNEEVLVKLFALKQKLKNYFLPLNARIVDIIGEAIFYSRYDINVWQDLVRVDDVELNINPCVSIEPNEGCSLITDLTAENFLGIKVPPDLNIAGVSDFVVYAVGVTQHNTPAPATPWNYSGIDTYTISDTVSSQSFSYTTPYRASVSEVVDGIMSEWESQLIEPWTNFNVTKEIGQDASEVPGITGAYAWFYAVQKEPIGPTSGNNFIIGATAVGGPTTFIYTTPGVTFTTDLGATFGTGPMETYASAFMGYFNGYNTPVSELNDYPCAPIGAPFVLSNCSFDIDWDKCVVNWNSFDYKSGGYGASAWSSFFSYDYSYTNVSYPLGTTNPYIGYTGSTYSGPSGGGPFTGATPGSPLHPPGPTYLTGFTGSTGPWNNPVLWNWENAGNATFTELEWIITLEDLPTPIGATEWVLESGLLSLADGADYPIILPYVGTYKVELILYDSFGGVSKWIQNSAICVNTKDVDFIGHFRARVCDYTWDTKTIERQSDEVPAPEKPIYPEWDMYNSTWQLPLQENEEMSMQDLTYNDLDRIEFYQTQNDPQFQGKCDTYYPPLNPGASPSKGLYDLAAYKWNLIEHNALWDDVCHLWWDITNPSITQARINHSVPWGTTPTFAFFKEPFVGKPNNVYLAEDIAGVLGIPGASYGDIVKNMNPNFGPGTTGPEITGVYQYLGGPLGLTGGSSWVESNIEINTFTLTDITDGGLILGNDVWKEVVRQFNENLEDNADAIVPNLGWPLYNIMNEFILYYQERYDDPLNYLDPYLQFVTKEYSINDTCYIRMYQGSGVPGSTFSNLPLPDESGATSMYVRNYQTVHFGDSGDIPYYFEMFAIGPSGGIISLPGPTTFIDAWGVETPGITYYNYEFGATNLSDLWQQLIYTSNGVAPTGPSAGITPIYIDGPIVDYEWNIVYGASGYTGPTGSTSFPPPTGLTAIKIQGYQNYFSSNDYHCVKFSGSTAIGATNVVLGGTSGIAGTMCGRSITSNSTWNNLRIHQYANEFPLLTQIQFNYSLSPMNGKIKPRWTLIKENDENWENIYYNNPYFSYLFTQPGSYTLELKLEDNLGNTRTKTKKEFVKII